MITAIQKLATALGDGGCYEFAIMRAGEVEAGKLTWDAFSLHATWIRAGYVQADCTVLHAGDCMGYLCGGRWTVLKAGDGKDSAGNPYDLPLAYVLQPGEHDIHRMEWSVTERPGLVHQYGHFFYAGPGEAYDSIDAAITLAVGHVLVSRRILRKVA
jgi:hypothetical protein